VIVLDTQHISQLQRVGTRSESRLKARLDRVPEEDVRVTIISPYEQLAEYLARINAASTRIEKQILDFRALGRLLEYYASWYLRILHFDASAANVFRQFGPPLIRRIGPRDARIAAIALAHDATLLSANLRDFQQVPGLRVEDWLRE
jgi:tRNA(fMet)-specific endonuclease VapC